MICDPIDRRVPVSAAALDRRQFLTSPVLLAGAASLARGLAAQPGWQIGCWTRPWGAFNYPVAFDGIAEAGYSYIGLMNPMLNGKAAPITHQRSEEHTS